MADNKPTAVEPRATSPIVPLLVLAAGGALVYMLTRQQGTTPPPETCVETTCAAGKHWVGQPTCACVDDVVNPPPTTGLKTLSWSTAAPLPNPRNFTVATASPTKLYCVGGLQDDAPAFTPWVDEYDPASNAWSRLPAMPTGRIAHGAEVINNYLYVISGFTETPGQQWIPADPSCYRINLATKTTWERIPDLPVGRRDFGTGKIGDNLYVIGGNIDDARSVLAGVYHLGTESGMQWYADNQMNVGRRYVMSGSGGNWIGAFGGIDNSAANVIEAFDGTNWFKSPLTLPKSAWGGGAVFVAPFWYIFTGMAGTDITGEVFMMDTRVKPNGAWTNYSPPPIPVKRLNYGVAAIGNKIYIVGGTGLDGKRIAQVDVATIIDKPAGMMRVESRHEGSVAWDMAAA